MTTKLLNKGQFYEKDAVYIPVFDTENFKIPITYGNIIILGDGKVFYHKNCVGNEKTIFICTQPEYFDTILHTDFNITNTILYNLYNEKN